MSTVIDSPALAATTTWARLTRPAGSTFSASNWAVLARHWFPVARLEELGAEPLAVQLLDVRLVVWRHPGGVSVARDQCPHRGVPLSKGWVEGGELTCPYHGLAFAGDGRCVRIPAQPQVVPSARFAAKVLPSVERYGLVWTCLDSADGVPGIVDFPEWDDPAFQPICCPSVTIQGSPGRQVEGFIDVAHFAFIHHRAFADRNNAAVPLYSTRATEFGFRSVYESSVSNYPHGLQHLAPEGFRWRRTFDVHPPFIALLRVDFPDDGVLRIMNIASPASAHVTRLFVPLVRNFSVNGSLEDVYAFNAQVFAEDQAMIEIQDPLDLPLDFDDEAHFAADKSSIAYRKALVALGLTA